MAVVIRQLEENELPQVAELANREGWNISLPYLKLCFNLDPSGWFGAVQTNKIIGCCVCAVLDRSNERTKDTARLGLFVVEKAYRKEGIGKRFISEISEKYLSQNILISALDPALCEKRSFKKCEDFQPWKLTLSVEISPQESSPKILIVSSDSVPLQKVEAFTAKINSSYSPRFFKDVTVGHASYMLVALDCKTDDIVGYGCLRHGPDAWMLQPLYAEDDDVALNLTQRLIAHLPIGSDVKVFPCLANTGAETVLQQVGFCKQDYKECVMFTKEMPKFRVSSVYSSSSLEFALA